MTHLWWSHLEDQVCLSVCLLSVCRHLTWTHNIFVPSWWNWTKFCGDFPWCLYSRSKYSFVFVVCLSFCELAYSLLKLNNFRKIFSSWRAICLKNVWSHSGDVNIYATNVSECRVCMAVCLFAYFCTKSGQKHIWLWKRYLVLEVLEACLICWYTSPN